MPAPEPQRDRLPGLDGLRAMACLAVFGVHWQQITEFSASVGPFNLTQLLINGNTGVSLFVTLSGFLLSMPMWRRGSTPPSGGWLSFALRRAARILPAYYVCLTVLVLLTGRLTSMGGIIDAVLHYVLIFNYTEKTIYSIAASFWALALLAQLYVLFPLLVMLLRVKVSRRLPAAMMVLAMIVGTYLAHAWVMRTAGRLDPWPLPHALISPDGYVLSHSLLAHLPHFLLGVLAAWAYVHLREQHTIGRAFTTPAECAFWLSLVGVLVILSTPLAGSMGLPFGRYVFPVVPSLIALMILTAPISRGAAAMLELWPIRQLGVISFGIYIYHLPALKLVNVALDNLNVSPDLSPTLLAVGGMMLTVVVSAVSYRFIEQPVLRRTRSQRGEIAGATGVPSDVVDPAPAPVASGSSPREHARPIEATNVAVGLPRRSPTVIHEPVGHPFAANVCTAVLIALACMVGLLGVLSVTHELSLPDWTGMAWRYPGTLRADGSLDGIPVVPPPWVMAVWCTAFVAMAAGAWWPTVALGVYLAMFIMVPRYNTQAFYIMVDAGPLHWAAALAAIAAAIHCVRRGQWPAVPRGLLTWMFLAFIAWICITTLAIPLRGLLWDPPHAYQPAMFLHALIMAGIAAVWMRPTAFWWLVAAVAAAVSARAMIDPKAVWLDGDIAAYAAMLLAMAIPGVLAARSMVLPPLLLLLGLNMAKLLLSTQNRGAAVGIAFALVVLWLTSRHKLILAIAGIPVAIAGAVVFIYSGLGARFLSLLHGGTEANSASERVGIWRGAWAMIKDHPIMGVGPGHFARHIQSYAPAVNSEIPAHNNFISITAETGIPGLLLYATLFVTAAISLLRVRGLMGRDTPGPEASAILAGLAAYMGAGMFLTRDNLVLAYVLVGVTAALYAGVLGRTRDPADQPVMLNDDVAATS